MATDPVCGKKKLTPMLIAGSASYGSYFNMPATNNPTASRCRAWRT